MKHNLPKLTLERSHDQVEAGLLEMDQLYGASFTDWLRNEENVSVAASYLQPIVSDYSFDQISEAVRWLENGWKSESTAWLIHELFQTWKTTDIDLMRAKLIRFLMNNWPIKKQAQFITNYLDVDVLYPHGSTSRGYFLKCIFQNIIFADLSQLFSMVGTSLDYASKVTLLQHAAKTASKPSPALKRSSETFSSVSLKRTKSSEPPTSGLGLVNTSANPPIDNNNDFRHQLNILFPSLLSRTYNLDPPSSVGLGLNFTDPASSSLGLDSPLGSPLLSPTFLTNDSLDINNNSKFPSNLV